jgi:ubiquinone/menaquinone biosynthesis C-methylase UbiE
MEVITRQNLRVRNSAADYDRYTSTFVDVYDQGMISSLKQACRSRGTDGVLIDIGTGTAQLPVKIACVPEFAELDIIGTEYFDDMVERARETIRARGLANRIRIDKADVHKMPYPSDHALFIISRSTVHHWADPVQAFSEIFRILKPGGGAIIHDLRRDADETALRNFNRAREEAGVGPTTLEEKYTAAEVMDILGEAGIRHQSEISIPTSGPGAIGIAIHINK